MVQIKYRLKKKGLSKHCAPQLLKYTSGITYTTQKKKFIVIKKSYDHSRYSSDSVLKKIFNDSETLKPVISI